MTPAIRVQDLRKRYGALEALRGVDLEIRAGEYFGLLGPNGAGKSTLINIVAGLVRASGGQAAVLGHDVVRDYRQARRKLGVVPQELVIDPFFTVRDMLRNQAGYYGCGREQWPWIDHVLEQLELTAKAGVFMRQLSGGMKRRVLIAMALAHKPPVVILDEPTAGVDVELRRALWRFTEQLHSEGHTIVLTTHYLEEAEQMCDRIAILNKGRLAALEDKAALLARHPYRFLRLRLEGATTLLPAPLQSRIASQEDGEIELRLHREHDRIGEVIESVRGSGLKILDVRTRDPSLEDIFVELTA